MKKTVLKVLALVTVLCIIAVTLIACNDANNDNKNESVTEKQVWLPYTLLDHFENCKYTYYYDEYGNEIKKTKADLNGNIQATWLCEYDDNQNLTKRSVDTGEGEPFVQLIQAYDDNGRLIEKREITTSSEYIYTYQYDEQNRLASMSSEGQIIETYVYEADGSYKIITAGNADEYNVYSADGKIQERHFGSDKKFVFSYNDSGNLLECTTYFGENIISKTVYHLDGNGNAIKVTQVKGSGDETVQGEYEYKLYTVKVK